jgi:hypothetical protein
MVPDHDTAKLTDPSQAIGQPPVTGEINGIPTLARSPQKIDAAPRYRLTFVYLRNHTNLHVIDNECRSRWPAQFRQLHWYG